MGKNNKSFKQGNKVSKGRPIGAKNKIYKKNLEDIARACREIESETGKSFDSLIVEQYKAYLKEILKNKKISPAIKLKAYNDYFDRLHGKAIQKIEQETTLLNKEVKIEITDITNTEDITEENNNDE